MNDYIQISRDKAVGFRWPERALGGLLVVLILLMALAIGVMILGMLVAGALVLASLLWWWRRRLRQSDMKNPQEIEGECRVLELRRVGKKED